MKSSAVVLRNREFHVEEAFEYDRRGPVRWVWSHVLRYPHLPLLLIASSIVNNAAYGTIQVYIGKSFDGIMGAAGAAAGGALTVLALVMAGAALLQGLTGLVRNYSVEFLAQRVERDCRDEYYASLLEKSRTFHGRRRVGDLMARATYDVHTLNLMFSPGFMLIVDSLMAYGVPMVMIALIDPRLLLMPVLFSVLLVVTLIDYNRKLKPVSIVQQEQYGKLSAGMEEIVAGIAAVKSNVQERYELQKFLNDARTFRDYFVQQGIIQAKYWPMLVFSVFWGGALFHGLLLWRQGALSLGEVIGFMGLFNTFRFVTYISLFSFNMVQHGMASAERILEIVKTETELDQNLEGISRPIRGRVDFETVFFSYNKTIVLRRVNFSIRPGMTVAIVGRTGSGKTTLTRLINRIFDPEVGNVLIDGTDVRSWNLDSLRSQIAVIEQDIFLFSRSIRDNIAFGREDASEEDIRGAAEQARAHEFILGFKDGYDTLVGDRGVTLSGGQRQRIALARAFLTDPRILILDDSTSAVDSKTEDEIQKAMRNISKDRTTFIITHRLSQIRWADHILVLHRGEVVAQGKHEDLLGRSGDYRRIFTGLEAGR
jgi:ATP-binding cassette subfamily B protein